MLRVVIQIVAFVVFMICAMRGATIHMDLLAHVNERLPPEQKISLWNTAGARRAYGRMFPQDPVLSRLKTVRTVGFASWAVFFACLVWR